MSLMLDSGAFAVWNRGESVDLDQYIQFCVDNPGVSYYVALDVIPGRPNDITSLTQSTIDGACAAGWDNYQRMLKHLPVEKVIPVFHQGDSLEWLERMLDFGSPYIGISPANDRTTAQRLKWLATVRPTVTSSDGRPLVKMHGFAVTGFRLMKSFPWYSVDSATWVQQGGRGVIYAPQVSHDEPDFSREPFQLAVSDVSPIKGEFNKHVLCLSPTVKRGVDKFLASCRVSYGESERVDVGEGYKLKKGWERWAVKGKTIVRVKSKGIMTCDQRRKLVNAMFFMRANEALPVEKIYLAGMGVKPKIEKMIQNRLLSYVEVLGHGGKKAFEWHRDYVEKE